MSVGIEAAVLPHMNDVVLLVNITNIDKKTGKVVEGKGKDISFTFGGRDFPIGKGEMIKVTREVAEHGYRRCHDLHASRAPNEVGERWVEIRDLDEKERSAYYEVVKQSSVDHVKALEATIAKLQTDIKGHQDSNNALNEKTKILSSENNNLKIKNEELSKPKVK